MWNFFSKLACLALSKLGFRIKPDFPAFISKVFFFLFAFNSVDRLKRKILQLQFSSSNENRRQVYVFNRITSFAINALGLLVSCEAIASYLKIPLSSLLAFGGVGGLTLGLSVKGVVSNFLGGLLLLLNEPFTPGDMVQCRSGLSSRDVELVGRVEVVGWGQTLIRGNDTR
jgi:small-conductance mechanosensitive channel